jgi:hypothetical protein
MLSGHVGVPSWWVAVTLISVSSIGVLFLLNGGANVDSLSTTLESSDPQQNGLLLSTKDAIHTHDPKDLSRLFDSVHADPDVKPVKGAFKTLTAIQNLGDVRDLSLLPNRKRSSPVERVARSFCIAPVASTKVPEG